jgi:lysophospholipase L1-like esterase
MDKYILLLSKIKTFVMLLAVFAMVIISLISNIYANDIIYECKGSDGATVHITNTPEPGRQCKIILGNESVAESQRNRHKSLKNNYSPHSLDSTMRVDDKINEINNSISGLKNFYKAIRQLQNNAINKVVIYHFGDSHVHSSVFPNQIEINLNKGFGNYKCDISGRPSVGIDYHYFGVSGKTIDYFSNSKDLRNDLANLKPHLIIVTLGTNDAFAQVSYEIAKSRLRRLVDIMKLSSPSSSILFTIPSDCFYKGNETNPYISTIRNTIIDYCNLDNCVYWDLYSIMGGKNSMKKWLNQGLTQADGVHFTNVGYLYQGDLIYRALMKGYQKFIGRQQNVVE